MKLTNWKKHLSGGVALCLFYAGIENFGVLFTVLVGVLAWEIMQLVIYAIGKTVSWLTLRNFFYHIGEYLTSKWLDCLVDMLMGVLGFTIAFIILSLLGLLPNVTVIW